MLNQVVLVGKVIDVWENDYGYYVKVSVERNYRNTYGDYDTDEILTWSRKKIVEVSINDLVGIKGRVEVGLDELVIVAEKISVLTANPEE